MSHRRARKDAKKAAAAEERSNVLMDQMRGVGHGLKSFRAMQCGKETVMTNGFQVKGGAGYTRPHPIGTKKARRKADKAAKASRARNHA